MKKILFTLLFAVMFTAFTIGFAACGGVEFKINFVVDGEIYATVKTGGAETIKMPDNPTKDDYSFDGWFWDKDTWTKPFTANSLLDAPLSSDMSVYAKFKSNHNHEYVEQITKEPTCTKKGEKTFTCECGDNYTEEINALGHDFGVWTTTQAPTCITKGVETRYCSHDNTHTETREINELDHEFTDYVSDGNATYNSDGTKTAACNHGCGATHTITDEGSKLPEIIEYFNKQADGSYYGKVYNATTTFDFNGKIESEKEFLICTDETCQNPLDENITSLTLGDNVFYIIFADGTKTTATIHRRLNYTVNFETDGGTNVAPQTIEEDRHLVAPNKNPMRVGYTFSAWDYDFNEPITDNTTITAIWNANTNTPYRIEYYLQNLEDDEYTFDCAEDLTGTTDTIATATRTYEHFTIIESTASANISPDGSLILKVYFTRNKYEFSVENENIKGGTIDCTENGTYKFGTHIILSVAVNAGYDFVGWYKCDTQISDELEYSFTLTEKTDITAKYFAHTDTPYKVEYYLENLDGTYTLQDSDTENLTGTTDTTAIIRIEKTYEHYNVVNSTVSGNINNDGSLILKVYYTRKQYKIQFSINNSNITLSKSYSGNYKFGTIIDGVTATFNNCLGYEWIGWYNGNEFIADDYTISSFTVDKNINYIATCSIKDGMKNFYFSSDTTTCTITGVKDKTIFQAIIPDYVTNIGYHAFSSCSDLTSLTIPNSVTNIGQGAFYNCYKLVEVINQSSLTIGRNDSNYVGHYALTIHNGESKIVNKNGYLFITDNGTNYLLGYSGTATELTLPSDYNGQNYQIYKYAFYKHNSLTSITKGNSVTSIGDSAFYGCSNLTSITIPDIVTNIGWHAFENCSSLTEITIPDSVTYIGSDAFQNCSSLTSVTIPNSIKLIGRYTFSNCRSLTSIYYHGTAEDWGKIDIDNYGNSYLTNATRYYYIETEPTEEGNFWHYDTDGITPVIWVKEN